MAAESGRLLAGQTQGKRGKGRNTSVKSISVPLRNLHSCCRLSSPCPLAILTVRLSCFQRGTVSGLVDWLVVCQKLALPVLSLLLSTCLCCVSLSPPFCACSLCHPSVQVSRPQLAHHLAAFVFLTRRDKTPLCNRNRNMMKS